MNNLDHELVFADHCVVGQLKNPEDSRILVFETLKDPSLQNVMIHFISI